VSTIHSTSVDSVPPIPSLVVDATRAAVSAVVVAAFAVAEPAAVVVDIGVDGGGE
jgi:hypothetical protein